MLLATAAQAREIDRQTIECYRIPGLLLMENAGLQTALSALPHGRRFAVFCGRGNNGGDGSVAARHLFCHGMEVLLILIGAEQELRGDAKTAFEMARSVGVPVACGLTEKVRAFVRGCDVILDGLVGIGCRGALTGAVAEAVRFINSARKYTIGIDVPSGVNTDNGQVEGEAVRCSCTVTFGVGKIGLMCHPGKAYAGTVCLKAISFAPEAVQKQHVQTETLPPARLPALADAAHKSSVGKTLVAAGSAGMTGAAYMAASAALKAGSGVVTLCVPASQQPVLAAKTTEIMSVPVADCGGAMAADAAETILRQAEAYHALVLGCGLSAADGVRQTVNEVVSRAACPLVLDADGLNVLDLAILKCRTAPTVLTPHIGEMARLTGSTAADVQGSCVQTARAFAQQYGTAVVLKSANTVAAFPDGTAYVNCIGNSGMATAGSGDVLAGIIGSLLGQGIELKQAVLSGVFLHSRSGDLAAERLGRRFMSASDLIAYIGPAMEEAAYENLV